jgi:acetyltransferase
MPAENLDKMFRPKSIAIVGASEEEGSVGRTIVENLVGGFKGEIFPVNPNRESVLGIPCLPSVKELKDKVDLAIVATPASTVPGIVEDCGEIGIPTVIIISAGFKETGPDGEALERRISEARREHGMRILGPNCLGLIVPSISLNASFADQMPNHGAIALISQSGALATAILDWSVMAQVGFSSFVSLGNMLDVNFGDLIDYFGEDPETRSILMYVESIKDARNFMSAARGFARTKPIVAVKSGKFAKSAQAAASHTGSLTGENRVYDAAFQRVGVTRVEEIQDLFDISKILETQSPPKGPRLVIITNAGGPGIMATDALLELEGELAELSEETIQHLSEFLPPHASKLNPVDIIGDANVQRYKETIETCGADKGVDGVLVIYTPQGAASPKKLASTIVQVARKIKKPLLVSMIGGQKIQPGLQVLLENDIPAYASPEQAVKSYMYMCQYARNLKQLYQTPEELPLDAAPPKYHLKALVRGIARSDREVMTEREFKKFLETYGIPVAETHVADDARSAASLAEKMGYPVVMKIHSPDITHKSDCGGVVLDLKSKEEVSNAFDEIVSRAQAANPDARAEKVAVQRMIGNVDLELIMGCRKDPIFGPAIMFGQGGTGVEIYQDVAVGFPPLNQVLASMLMEETKVFTLLKGYRNKPPANVRLLEEYLVRFSQMIIDFPEIKEVDINPLAVVGEDFIALDARIIIDKELALAEVEPHAHLVIEPYPTKYVESWVLNDGRPVVLRPIRPEDEPLEFELWETFSPETFRYRFFGPPRKVTHDEMVRYTNIDYRREMAIIAELEEDDRRKMIGVGRLIIDADGESGEFAVVVGDPWQGLGLGTKLVDAIIGVSGDKKLSEIHGVIQADNYRMIHVCREMGFQIEQIDGSTVGASLKLR